MVGVYKLKLRVLLSGSRVLAVVFSSGYSNTLRNLKAGMAEMGLGFIGFRVIEFWV